MPCRRKGQAVCNWKRKQVAPLCLFLCVYACSSACVCIRWCVCVYVPACLFVCVSVWCGSCVLFFVCSCVCVCVCRLRVWQCVQTFARSITHSVYRLLGFLGHAVNDTSKHSLILSSTLAHRKRRGPDFLPHTVHKWIR